MQLAIVIPLSDLGGSGLVPGMGLPTPPVYPGHGVPGQPLPGHGLPVPTPPVVDLPPQLGTLPVYPATPTNPIAPPPGVVWPPLGPEVPRGKALAVVFISGFGYRWTVIDTSLMVTPLPTPPATPR